MGDRPYRFGPAAWRWLQETPSLGVLITDAELVIQGWNRWLEERSGLALADVFGRNLLDAYPNLAPRRSFYEAALQGESRFMAQRFHRFLLPMSAPGLTPARQMEQKAVIAPLWEDGRVIGTITVIDDVTRRVLDEEALRSQINELELVRTELKRFSADLEHSLAHERELVQTFAKSFLQDCPPDTALDLACLYRAAFTADRVGGDFFDFIVINKASIGAFIGDVCGKGVKAGVYTAMAKYTLRAYAFEDATPGPLLRRVNDALCRQITDAAMFISLVYVHFDLERGVVEWVNAGHPSPVLIDAMGQEHYLKTTAPVLGALSGIEFASRELPFRPGYSLALFTDGVTEANRARVGEESQVAEIMQASRDLQAGAMADRLFEYASEACHGRLLDDVAIVIARYPLVDPHTAP